MFFIDAYMRYFLSFQQTLNCMKKTIKLILNFILFTISSHCCAQMISLGNDENAVYNTLYDRVNSYNRSQGDHNMQTFDVLHNNGAVSEIIISMQDGYVYDLGLNSDYAIHYVMKNGMLNHITTIYESISIDQLQNGFNRLYGERHIDNYYFSDDYKSFKIILLDKNGLASVIEQSTYDTHFPPQVASLLDKLGIANKFPSNNKKMTVNQSARFTPNISNKTNAGKNANITSGNQGASKGANSTEIIEPVGTGRNDNIDSINASLKKLVGTKQNLNLDDMIGIIKKKQLSVSEIKNIIQKASSRTWIIRIEDTVVSFSWDIGDESMEYNPKKHTFSIESNFDEIYNSIIKELELNKYKKTIYKPEEGQISKIRYENANYKILCCKDQGGSMGNSPCTIIVSRSQTFNGGGN